MADTSPGGRAPGRDRLAGPAWIHEAARLIADLGFEVITGEHPGTPTATDLVIALREKPTLRHYDPEEIQYWTIEGGRGRPARLDRGARDVPLEGRFAWGRISIDDRLGMGNQFLAFGGTVRAAYADPATLVVLFSSAAPIQRWAGHSQGTDPLTGAIGAFFGRLMVPIDFREGAEARVSATDPLALYAAFVHDLEVRLRRSEWIRDAHRGFAAWTPREAHRLEAEAPAAWREGLALLDDLGLAGGREPEPGPRR